MTRTLFSYRLQISGLVSLTAHQSNRRPATVYKSLYGLLFAFYGVDVYALPRASKRTTLLVVAERHDLLEPLYRVAQAEEIASRKGGVNNGL